MLVRIGSRRGGLLCRHRGGDEDQKRLGQICITMYSTASAVLVVYGNITNQKGRGVLRLAFLFSRQLLILQGPQQLHRCRPIWYNTFGALIVKRCKARLKEPHTILDMRHLQIKRHGDHVKELQES